MRVVFSSLRRALPAVVSSTCLLILLADQCYTAFCNDYDCPIACDDMNLCDTPIVSLCGFENVKVTSSNLQHTEVVIATNPLRPESLFVGVMTRETDCCRNTFNCDIGYYYSYDNAGSWYGSDNGGASWSSPPDTVAVNNQPDKPFISTEAELS